MADHKYALVTAGSRGIGRRIVLKLASQGMRVAIHYFRNIDAAKETLRLVREAGTDGVLIQADVTDMAQVRQIFDEVRGAFGALDVLVSNARPKCPNSFRRLSTSPHSSGMRR